MLTLPELKLALLLYQFILKTECHKVFLIEIFCPWCATWISNPIHKSILPSISASMEAWKFLINHPNPRHLTKQLGIPLKAYEHLLQSIIVTTWIQKGLTSFQDLNPQTVEKYSFTYLWIQAFHQKHPLTTITVDAKLWQYLLQPGPNKFSWFYKYLQYSVPFSKTAHMVSWERDLGKHFSDEEWQHALAKTLV